MLQIIFLGYSFVSIVDDTDADSDYIPHKFNINNSSSHSSNNHDISNLTTVVENTNQLLIPALSSIYIRYTY